MNRVKEIFSSVPEGKELLELAETNGCAIIFNPDLPKDTYGMMDFRGKAIHLNPASNDYSLLGTLAHELRHLWQACIIDMDPSKILFSPYAFAFTRLIEGDAFAFSEGFLQKIRIESGASLKEIFFHYQQKSEFEKYDQETLRRLEILHSQKAEILARFFNHASGTMDENILKITADGLTDADPNYLDFKSVQEMSDAILAYVPQETLEKAQKLVENIKRSAQTPKP